MIVILLYRRSVPCARTFSSVGGRTLLVISLITLMEDKTVQCNLIVMIVCSICEYTSVNLSHSNICVDMISTPIAS